MKDLVEEATGLQRLGRCSCPDPVIIDGKKYWAAMYGLYARGCPACTNFVPYNSKHGKTCGNCIYWESTSLYE